MKYETWYSELISRAVARGWTRNTSPLYVECHHILPRSLGGDDSPSNLVYLTAREHYVAHLLLCRFGDTNQKERMLHAMQRFMYSMRDRSHIKSRTYGYIKERISQLKSQKMRNNSLRRGIPHTEEVKKAMSNVRAGVPKLQSTKLKMSASAKLSWATRDNVTCPHCGKTSRNKSNMTRWHFDNCKGHI